MEKEAQKGRTEESLAADRLLVRAWNACRPGWKEAFFTAFITGMLTHLYLFCNNFLTWDSMFSLYAPQEMTGIGRPVLRYLCGISTDFNLPLVLGTLSVFYLSMTAAALVECFGIKSRTGRVLAAALTVTFPVVTGTFCYLFTADGYMAAFFLSVLSVLFAEQSVKETKRPFLWIVAGMAAMAVSLGIYQAYFAVAITLCLLKILLFLQQESLAKTGRFTAACLGMGIGGYGLYLLLVKGFCLVKGVGLLSYNGVDRLEHFVPADVPRGIYTAYRQFFSFALRSNVLTVNAGMTVCVTGLCLIGAAGYLYCLVKSCKDSGVKNRSEGIIRIGAAVLCVCLLPLGATIFCVMSPDVFLYILMRMPWLLFFLFVLTIAERMKPGIQIMTVILTAVSVFQFYLMANVVYYNMNEKYEKSYALCVRLADRIEQQEGYYPWIQTVFIGAEPDYMKYPSTEVTKEVLSGYYPARGDFFLNSTDKYAEFLSHYLSVSLAPAEDSVEEALLQNEAVLQMDTFPAEDSVQIIDGVLVVRMSDKP